MQKTTYRRPVSEQARLRANAYQRKYRAAHPDKARQWRDNYTLKRADRLRAEQAQMEGGAQNAEN